MAFGVTPTGFIRKRLEDIKAEIEQSLRDTLGENINLLPEELLGQLVGVFSERDALIWEDMEALFDSQFPATAEAVPLDNVSSITGSIRKTPSKSVVTDQLFFGTPATVILQGNFISVIGNAAAQFVTLANVTLIAGTDEVQTTTFSGTPTSGSFRYTFGGIQSALIVFTDDAAAVKTKLEAMSSIPVGSMLVTGSFAAGFVKTFQNPGFAGLGKRDVALLGTADNTLDDGAPVTISVVETTPGVPQGTANVEAVTTGATVANANTLRVIDSPVAGWSDTVNALDAVVGQAVESDAAFKLRRLNEVARAGAATPNAIFADVSAVNAVTAVVVFFNNTDVIDVDLRPPHSVDIVVQDGDDDDIALAIFNTVGAGIDFFGSVTKLVTDSQGFSQTIKFSRPTEIDIHVEIDLTVGALFPVDGLAQVEAAILAYAARLTIGDDVVVFGSDPNLSCSFQDVPGVTDVVIRVGTAASPTLDDNIVIAAREIAKFDTSRITVITV